LELISPASSITGKLYKSRCDPVFTRLPRQVEGVDRNAAPAKPRARVKGHEAERLCLGGVNDFPDIDVHLGVDLLQFIHECDIDFSVIRLCGGRGRNRNGLGGEPVV
jgi:hypothetical protein